MSCVWRPDSWHIKCCDARPHRCSHTDTPWTCSLFIRAYKKVLRPIAEDQLLGRCAVFVPSAGNAYRASHRGWDTLGAWHTIHEDPPTTNQRRSFKIKLYLRVMSECRACVLNMKTVFECWVRVLNIRWCKLELYVSMLCLSVGSE